MKIQPIHIKAILFHLSGTLVQEIRQIEGRLKKSIGCPPQTDLVEYIQNRPTSAERKQVLSDLETPELKNGCKIGPRCIGSGNHPIFNI